MLGETFEMITPQFKLLCETVSHHPNVLATHIIGDGFDLSLNSKMDVSFNGRELHGIVTGERRFVIRNPTKDEPDVYLATNPDISFCIGNIFIGDRFCEPQGTATLTNVASGECAEYTFYKRKMFGNKSDDI